MVTQRKPRSVPEGYRIGATPPKPIKVHTMRGVQHHRGRNALVYPPDGAPVVRCGEVHKTERGALDCAAYIARCLSRGEPWAWGPRLEWKNAKRDR